MKQYRLIFPALMTSVAVAALTACGGSSGSSYVANDLPTGVTQLSIADYTATAIGNGLTAGAQDLLTAGLGKTGLGTSAAPAYLVAASPTALELRRNAIHSNYRALLDPTVAGGYGSLYGPNIDVNGFSTLGEGLIPGKEYTAVLDDVAGQKRVVMAVLIPSSFSVDNPCIVVGPSSGSRGVYGAIATAGEWGLKRGCAVALTDTGKGMGLYDMTDDSVHKFDGTRTTRTLAGSLAHFAANITDSARSAFNTLFANRLALKHAHSQQNPEKDWGSDTLAAVKYALYALNQEYSTEFVPNTTRKVARFSGQNTLVIAGSVSNGAGAVLRAAELDSEGLIDGVVAGEPNAQPASTSGYGITFAGSNVATYGKSTLDYFTYANVFQPCAALATAAALTETSTFNYYGAAGLTAFATNRCSGLAAKGLVTGATTTAQADDALSKMRNYGWTTDNDTMHNAHFGLGNATIISMMYANAHGRFSVTDNICGMSLAKVDSSGNVVAISGTDKAATFASGNGTANGAPASVVYNNSSGGAKSWLFGVSPSTGMADFSLDAALCLRALVTGTDHTGAVLTSASTPTLAQSNQVKAGIAEVQLSGNLRGKPTIIVTGRSDALLPINNASRAYVSYNKSVEGSASQVTYYEVLNAQHFDSFIPFGGFDTRFVPLHVYFNRSMDAMYAKLKNGTAIPGSQVIRTTARGGTPGAAPALTVSHVPVIATSPSVPNVISFSGSNLAVPN